MKIFRQAICRSLLLAGLLGASPTGAQEPKAFVAEYSFIKASENVIAQPHTLGSLFSALRRLQNGGKGQVRIVHIGDSHIQADMMTGPIRRALQALFGNAGRGLVFPYTVAGSNAPLDVKSVSNQKWQANRLAHPEIPIACGVAGFGIHSSSPEAFIDLRLAPDAAGTDNAFDRVTLFGAPRRPDSLCYSLCPDSGVAQQQWLRPSNSTGALVYNLPKPVTGIRIAPCGGPADGVFSLYGVLLEKAAASGLRYDVIGVNGATFDQYNNTPLFWQGLPQLAADCYILSMGTNEAQKAVLNRDSFRNTVRTMVEKLRAVSPHAAIIITTPAGSHRHNGKPNAVLSDVRDVLTAFCAGNGLACWDLYGATGGYTAAPDWQRRGLMARDGIHYNRKGYELQAALFMQALEAAYQHGGK